MSWLIDAARACDVSMRLVYVREGNVQDLRVRMERIDVMEGGRRRTPVSMMAREGVEDGKTDFSPICTSAMGRPLPAYRKRKDL